MPEGPGASALPRLAPLRNLAYFPLHLNPELPRAPNPRRPCRLRGKRPRTRPDRAASARTHALRPRRRLGASLASCNGRRLRASRGGHRLSPKERGPRPARHGGVALSLLRARAVRAGHWPPLAPWRALGCHFARRLHHRELGRARSGRHHAFGHQVLPFGDRGPGSGPRPYRLGARYGVEVASANLPIANRGARRAWDTIGRVDVPRALRHAAQPYHHLGRPVAADE